MISIAGEFLSGEISRSQDATLYYDGGQALRLVYADGELKNNIEQIGFSSRLGNIPRYVNFCNGSKFVTTDNDMVDDLMAQLGIESKGQLLHKLESNSIYVALSLALLFATVIYSITVVIPRLADETARLAPVELTDSITSTAMDAFDQSLFSASEVPEHIQTLLKDEFEFIAEPHSKDFNFKLHFRKSDFIGANAFALPSGDIVITDALLNMANNKDEIIAILAHEMGHVIHRHGIRRLFEDSMIAVLIFSVTGDVTQFSQVATALPALLISRHYSRDYEQQADLFAHKVMSENNMDLSHFTNILARIDEGYKKHANVSTFFSTHPHTEDRIKLFQNQSVEIESEHK